MADLMVCGVSFVCAFVSRSRHVEQVFLVFLVCHREGGTYRGLVECGGRGRGCSAVYKATNIIKCLMAINR